MPDMLVRLYDLPDRPSILEKVKAQGVTIRRAMAYEKHRAVKWVDTRFGTGWASECDVAFSNRPISCLLATEAGRVIGFACHDTASRGFFGPTGVEEAARGHGVGTALLLATLLDMRQAGYAYAIIGRAGPADFYAKTVGASMIPGSEESIYRDLLKREES